MLGTDRSLRLALGYLHPLVIRATAVAPPPRWTTEARRVLATATDVDLSGAIRRTLASLLRSDIVSRPDILAGGLRLANQRLARGLLWFASVALDAPAELIGSVGVRMGTSGRNDAVVRDTAVANTCAALLGASNDPGAAAALATMRVRVTNRNVLKQVDRALEVVAERAGMQVATVIELALPTFDLGPDGRIELPIDGTTAVIAVTRDATVRQVWRETDGTELDRASTALATTHPAEVADVAERVAAIRAAIVEERRRMEDRLASSRAWPEPLWRSRYADHPIGRIFGCRLIWQVSSPGEAAIAARRDGDRLGRRRRPPPGRRRSARGPSVAPGGRRRGRDRGLAGIARRRGPGPTGEAGPPRGLPARSVVTSAWLPTAGSRDASLGTGTSGPDCAAAAGRSPRSVPGTEATRRQPSGTFEDGLRAELRYQAVDQVPTGHAPGACTPRGRAVHVSVGCRMRCSCRSRRFRRGSSRRRSVTSAWSRSSHRRPGPIDRDSGERDSAAEVG